MPFYHISQPNEFLCKTGVGIDDVLVVKKCFQLPGQSVVRFSISPHSYSLEIQAMSLEKLEFRLPAVFTVGAKDSPEALCKYARILTTNQRNVAELVKGIVEGEMRVICAGLTIEEIFKDRQLFKDRALGSIDKELSVFGLTIYNVNIKQIMDVPGSEYFKYMRVKVQEGAVNQAKVEVAKARMLGSVGEKEKDAETRKQTSRVETDTNKVEQESQLIIEKARAEIQTIEADYDTQVNLAEIEAHNKANYRNEELKQAIEKMGTAVAQERERAERISKATVDAEVVEALADANFYRARQDADAKLYEQRKVAEADQLLFDAQSTGIRSLQKAFKGDNKATLAYLLMEQNLFADLAQINSEAIEDLCPKISILENDLQQTQRGENGGFYDLLTTLPPMLGIFADQTGIEPPEWLMQLPKQEP